LQSSYIIIMKDRVWGYLQQAVVVVAHGVKYSGIFKGADEDWVFLQCETTWVQIPWPEITSFEPAPASQPLDRMPNPPETYETAPSLKVIKGEKDDPDKGKK
jgi:hypothetical protein